MFEELAQNCPDDAKRYREILERKRIFKFFMGFNKHLDEFQETILGIKPLPHTREICSEVRREESRKKVMLGDGFKILSLSKTLPWLFGALITIQTTEKEREGFGVIIVENQVILEIIIGKCMKNLLI